MSYECCECGRVHDELPRFFMSKLPETEDGKVIRARLDRQSMCRTDDRFFVLCEIELQVIASDSGPLGFIGWVEVEREDYQRLLTFRENEDTEAVASFWLEGTLANPVTGVTDSFGTAVMFEVVKDDPTPYVKRVAPGQLASFFEDGVSLAFWHAVAQRVNPRHRG